MNWILLGIGMVASVGLSSCGGMGGEQVDEPTVEKMSQLESQWGMKPRKTQPRGGGSFTVPDGDAATPVESPSTPVAPGPATVAPAPQLAPQPQASNAPDSEPPNLSTLQKLR